MNKRRPCSTKLAGLLDTPVRRLVHDPHALLQGLVNSGQTAVDIGCGPGFFTLPMAQIVGESGKVIAVDVQQEMLDRLYKKAIALGLQNIVQTHKPGERGLGLDISCDFALAFFMAHEVPDPESMLLDVFSILRPGGKFLLTEPKLFVSKREFADKVSAAKKTGFVHISEPDIWLARSVLLERH